MQTDLPVDGASSPAGVLFLAVVQGLAEFLPISSSGHLVLTRVALGIRGAGLTLDVALHVGTLLAVVWAYRFDVADLVRDLFQGRWRFIAWLVLATVPVGAVGVLLHDPLERAFQSPRVAGIGLLVTASVLLLGERFRRRNEALGPADEAERDRVPPWSDALYIGLAQTLAIAPGVSRAGTTIAAGLMRGHGGARAARLSFLMSLPAVSGAAIVELPDAIGAGFGDLGLGLVGLAVAVSAFVGWLALRFLLLTLARGAFRWFALYCAVLGVTVLAIA